jgi:hypothetical protein
LIAVSVPAKHSNQIIILRTEIENMHAFHHLQTTKAIRPLLLLLLLLPCLLTAGAQPSPTNGKHIALPQLSDGIGWKQPQYYSTIQTVDLDGDGQSEVLARWIDGLSIYRFANGALLRHSRIPALSDRAGFDQPSWYATIHAAVLDPRRKQADVIAREQDGVHVFRYDGVRHYWKEVGAHASIRPFADTDAGGTDWTQAKYYSTIQLVDVTGDGAAELLGRGRSGMQAWHWNPVKESWTQLAAAGELADDQGFDQEAYYDSVQFVDLDHDGIAELIARTSEGVQTYKWASNEWATINGSGPFADDAGMLTGKRYKSVRTSMDATGQAWLYGLTSGSDGSAAIEVHSWQQDHWQLARTIPLPGTGWDRESQSATLRAADIQGDATPEFVVRGRGGLQAYTLAGTPLPVHSQSFTDAQGWNLLEQSGTLRIATALLPANGGTQLRTVVVGRGSNGLEAYQFAGQWTDAAQAGFPQYCANFTTDISVQCVAYKAISNKAVDGATDIRSLYTEARYNSGDWNTAQGEVSGMANPNNDPGWLAMRSEMAQELGDVSNVRAWFMNNYSVLNDNYTRSPDLLTQAESDVILSASTSVVSKWVEFAADIVSGISDFFPEAGPSTQLIISILENTYNDVSGSGGDVTEELSKIATDLNSQKTNLNSTNANQQTAYLTNYSKLQQIGSEKANGGYDWANATVDVIADAQNGGANGMLINFYRLLLPAKWQVYWCDDNNMGLGPGCNSDYTEAKYNCLYGTDPYLGFPTSNAYIYAGSSYVNWSLLDRLTGTLSGGATNLDAIWYMMLLGGDLGWDLPQYGLTYSSDGYLNTPDPQLAYPQIEHGYSGQSSNCAGNGSTNGIIGSTQTLSQRLSIAQQNTARVTASEAPGILREIHALNEEAKAVSPDSDAELDLTSPLRAAVKLVEPANAHTRVRKELSVSATTPTHLMELFIRRAQLLTPRLGKRSAQQLTTHAYCLIGKLEGQDQTRESCRR